MVLTCPAIQYPTKVASIIGIWKINCLIPQTEEELMGRHRLTREGNAYLCIRAFPKENIILTQYKLRAWWLHLLDGLGHYVIRPGVFAPILMMASNIMTLGYTYVKNRPKNTPNILCQISHTSKLIVWTPSKISWTPELQGREQSLLRPRFPKSFTGTKNQ